MRARPGTHFRPLRQKRRFTRTIAFSPAFGTTDQTAFAAVQNPEHFYKTTNLRHQLGLPLNLPNNPNGIAVVAVSTHLVAAIDKGVVFAAALARRHYINPDDGRLRLDPDPQHAFH